LSSYNQIEKRNPWINLIFALYRELYKGRSHRIHRSQRIRRIQRSQRSHAVLGCGPVRFFLGFSQFLQFSDQNPAQTVQFSRIFAGILQFLEFSVAFLRKSPNVAAATDSDCFAVSKNPIFYAEIGVSEINSFTLGIDSGDLYSKYHSLMILLY
jgi:hypothetical protein